MPGQQYDAVAPVFDDSLDVLTYARHCEEPTYRAVIGDVTGLDVLDLGAGTGIWTRRIRRAGARRVEGVDISPGMVEVARQKERAEPLGITYHLGDVTRGGRPDWSRAFDVVTGVNVLHYSATREALAGMCATAFDALKPHGRLVATCANWDMADDPAYYEPYGMRVVTPPERTEGAPVATTATIRGEPVTIVVHLWRQATYEDLLRAAGFTAVTWHPLRISQEGTDAYGADYWRPFTRQPLMLLLEATA